MRHRFAYALAIAAVLAAAPASLRAQYYQPCCGGVEIVPQREQQNRQFEAEQAQRRLDEQRRQLQQLQEQQRLQQRAFEWRSDCLRSRSYGDTAC